MYKIMAVNAGSSSLKFQLLEMPEELVIVEGLLEKIGLDSPQLIIKQNGLKDVTVVNVKNHAEAVKLVLKELVERGIVKTLDEIAGVGHRVLHCGEKYNDSVIMSDEAIAAVESVNDLGPLHNPANLTGIKAFKEVLPNVVQVGVFDTSFHLSMPDEAYMYAVPYTWYEKYGVRKYGFHGTSHKYVAEEAAKKLGKPLEELRLITAHIGNGASLAAIKYGKVVDTTMGLTPLEGLPMGTRSGSFDPAIIEFICKKFIEDGHKDLANVSEITRILNKESGYIGFYPKSSDARDVREAADSGNYLADLILRMQEKKIADYIGSFFVYMGGVDAIIFTAGIGEKSPDTRREVCNRLKEALGIEIDPVLNELRGEYVELTPSDSKIKVLVVPTNEELMIARDVIRVGNIQK